MHEQYYLGKLDLSWTDDVSMTYFGVYDEDSKDAIVSELLDVGDYSMVLDFGSGKRREYSGNDVNDSIEWTKIPTDEVRRFVEQNICDDHNSMAELLENALGNIDDEDYIDDEDEEEY